MKDLSAWYRKIQILRLIPRYPARVGLSTLHEKLKAQGFNITKRSLQRDVKELSMLFEIESDGNKDIPGWYWKREAERLELPEMAPSVALSFKMMKLFLAHFLPPCTLNDLSSYFDSAEKVLAALPNNQLASWSDKVALISRNQPLLAPSIDSTILNDVYSALLSERQIKVHYHPRYKEPRDYVVNPLGLVAIDQVLYLVCTLWEYKEVKQLALHRMVAAEMLDAHSHLPVDFDLQSYVKKGEFEYLVDEHKIDLVIIVNRGIAQHLAESKLSEDQVMTPLEDGRFKLEARVNNTQQLRWWLLGFGAGVEVVAPPALREKFKQTVQALSSLYQDS